MSDRPQPYKTVAFSLACAEPRAWVAIKSGNASARLIEMRQAYTGIWMTYVDLPPGTYRCCYYCGDDKKTVYYGPAHVPGSSECGIDALFHVQAPVEVADETAVVVAEEPWSSPLGRSLALATAAQAALG